MIKLTEKDLMENFKWKDKSSLTKVNKEKIAELEDEILDEVKNSLINFIDLKTEKTEDFNEYQFKEKLKEACSGSGDEIKKITTVYSSSLCALLFFYNISKEKPLILEYNKTKFKFTDVLFEFQNAVIRNPSNVDIVLLGKKCDDENNKNVILFLESKFFEYCRDVTEENKKFDIPEGYFNNDIGKKIYKKNNLFNNSELELDEKSHCIIPKKEDCYIEGIKQMISHYIGIKNLLEGKFYNEKNNLNLKKLYAFLFKGTTAEYEKIKFDKKELIEKLEHTEIYLGEILFDFHNMNIDNKKKFEDYFNNYSDRYQELVKVLEDIENKDEKKINLLPMLFTYSLFNEQPNKEDEIEYTIIHKVSHKIKEKYKLK